MIDHIYIYTCDKAKIKTRKSINSQICIGICIELVKTEPQWATSACHCKIMKHNIKAIRTTPVLVYYNSIDYIIVSIS